MTDSFSQLLDVQESRDGYLAPLGADRSDPMFGGLMLAQAIAAVEQTVPEGRTLHSLHAYFLRPGATNTPLLFSVEDTRNGRSFNHREARAYQDGREVFRMLCSHSADASSPVYCDRAMPDVPGPDDVDYTYDDFCRDVKSDPSYLKAIDARPMDIRYINPPTDRVPSSKIESQKMWMRIPGAVGDEPWCHVAGLAFLSDSTLIDHVTLPHGRRWQDADFYGTSLDHAMWFHQPSRADDWHLFDQVVEWTGSGRGLACGRFFSVDGSLVATCMQEGLMRL